MSTTQDPPQNLIYVAINLHDILYGVELVLYFRTMYALLNHPGKRTRSDVFYAVFTSVMLLMTTIWVSVQALFGQRMWILDASPDSLSIANIWNWYMDMAMLLLILLQLMTDGLMVYRCWIIWNSYHAIIIPLILWTGTLVLGILVGWTSIVFGGLFSHVNVAQLTLAYYTVSAFLTAMLTCMICYRLVRHGRLMKVNLGHEYASTYFAIVALVVESVLPCTLSGVAFLISLGVGSQTETVFGHIYALMMCISPQILILRVAMKAWTNDTGVKLPPSTIKFSPREDTTPGTASKVSNELCAEALGSLQKGNDNIV